MYEAVQICEANKPVGYIVIVIVSGYSSEEISYRIVSFQIPIIGQYNIGQYRKNIGNIKKILAISGNIKKIIGNIGQYRSWWKYRISYRYRDIF